MEPERLREELTALLAASGRPHVERLTVSAAIVSEALRATGLEATLLGGGAVEFYDPGADTTSDIDLVVERARPIADLEATLQDAFTSLGFARAGRHWARDDLFVEIPDIRIVDPTETFRVGRYLLRVLRKEIVLGERIVDYKHWRYTGFGAQALDMIAAFGPELDDAVLRPYLRREGAEDAYDALRALATSGRRITEPVLRAELERLLARGVGE
ncbi:MAG TPA: hypothetical protein VFQ38_06170 [Longimicrobiales bacterium]|nr:hypothetical protein [Longimicrobiales bacterium]